MLLTRRGLLVRAHPGRAYLSSLEFELALEQGVYMADWVNSPQEVPSQVIACDCYSAQVEAIQFLPSRSAAESGPG